MSYWDDYRRFKPSIPREAKGGIKAQSKRGTFGESWWARRWITVLESFNIGARLGRGRSYARRGQVLSIEINKGKVGAKVQGSRPKPYNVDLQVKILSASDWQKLAKVLSRQAIFSAKLLMGEMPLDIEKAFKEAELSLFPEKLKDLNTDCSCPDWSNPCKHIAAVYYLLAEEFDRDPFLIFKLRGMNREDLITMLSRPDKKAARKKAKPKQEPLHKDEEGLSSDISKFWNGEPIPDDIFGEIQIPPIPAALPKRLGSFPFWRGEEKFLDVMESIYKRASTVGLRVFLGEQVGQEENLERNLPSSPLSRQEK
jgi:uncharacterized Zn finger protein